MRICRDCDFWEPISRGYMTYELGECRIKAPSTGRDGRWPTTNEVQWCGEFQKKTEKEKP